MDSNGDSLISRAEVQAWVNKNLNSVCAHQRKRITSKQKARDPLETASLVHFAALFDADKNYKITSTNYLYAVFTKLDVLTEDGFIDKDELSKET